MISHLVRCGVAALVVVVAGCGSAPEIEPDIAAAEPVPTPASSSSAPPPTVPAAPVAPVVPAVISVPAERAAAPVTVAPTLPPPTSTTTIVVYPDTPCSEWYPTAMAAGFTHDEWMSTVARVMWAESRCDPNADNGVCCIGLMQIHAGVWDCASFDPLGNLQCARHVQRVQGWSAWTTY